MDLDLTDARALVLAGSSGLGRAVAAELAREGARVVLCSRDAERAETAASEIRAETDREVYGVEADVADAASVKALVDGAAERLGGLDVLVTNAGGPPPGNFADTDEDAWDRAYALTLQSVARSVRHALPHLRASDRAAVLSLASSSVVQPIPNLLLSNVFRPAVRALAKHLAEELAPDGVRVNVLSPGRIHTARVDALDGAKAEREGRDVDDVRAEAVGRIPAGRLGQPVEFGRVAAFLCSPSASYVTGTHLLVDGGLVRAL